MVVKDKKGRRRYVVFSVSGDMTKDAIIRGLRSAAPDNPPYIIQCASGKAILRCSPESREETVRTMSRIDPSSSPLATSGTIRKIRCRYPELKAVRK